MNIKKSSLTIVVLFFCSLLAGAVAVQAEATFTVDSTRDVVDANPGDGICATADGECTLRAAIQETNALPGADTINLPQETFILSLPGTNEDASASGDLDITDDLSIQGDDYWTEDRWATIQGAAADRIFHILPGVTVVINYVVIFGGEVHDASGGAGILNQGILELYDSDVTGNFTIGTGGGIRNEGEIFLYGSDIIGNEAEGGGGIYNSGVMNMYNSSVNDNRSMDAGGGIFNAEEGEFSLLWSGINSNTVATTANGGGIYNLGYMELGEIAQVSYNTTNGSGGGIYNAGTMQVIDLDSTFNVAELDGGSIFNIGTAHIQSSLIYKNTASSGAGIYCEWLYAEYPTPPTMTLDHLTVENNNAALVAGGILNAICTINIENSTIQGNTADIAGGAAMFSGITNLTNTSILNNTATSQGGGIYNHGDIHLTSSFIDGNSASAGGGFYNNQYSLITLSDTSLTANSARNGGGFHNAGIVSMMDSILQYNTAEIAGGGLYNLGGYADTDRSSFYQNSAQIGGAIWNGSSNPQAGEVESLLGSSDGHISELFSIAQEMQREKAEEASAPEAQTPGFVIALTSTFGANTATNQGGGIFTLDEVQLANNTFSDNTASEGDSIFLGAASARVVIGNTILASSDVNDNCAGLQALESVGFNLETGDSCGLHSDGDLVETDPLLMLGAFPGIGLDPRSPAIDSGSNELCGNTDQRGEPRPIDGNGDGQAICDIGSYEAPEPDLIFADVPLNHWAYDFIIPLYEDGYIAGCATDPERQFCPEISMNRSESSVFIVRGIHPDQPGYLPPTPTTQYFNDVPIGSDEEWFSKWVGELKEEGFTSGCDANQSLFCPGRKHIRAEATVFYLRLLNGPYFEPDETSQQIYTDVALDAWYHRWVNAAHEAGLIQDCQTDMENMLFRPEEELTRAEAACMMKKATELPLNPQGGTIVESDFSDVALLNPILATDQASSDVNSKLFLGLLKVDAFSGELVGEIAEGWQTSPDGLTYTFNLRGDIYWSDGTPVTATDVKFTFDAIGSDQVSSPHKYILESIENIEIVNDQTIRIVFYATDCNSLNNLTIGIIPAHKYASDFSDIMSSPLNEKPIVTNGPFKFREWVRDDHITLTRNTTYHLGAPKVDAWIRRIYADSSAAMAAFIAGEIDVMNVEPQNVATIEAEITKGQPFAIKQLFTDGYNYLAMNNGDPDNPEIGWVDLNADGYFNEGEPPNIEQAKHPILGDKLVRQAIAYAIDYNTIINEVAFGQGAPIPANVLPAVGWAYNSNLEPYALNLGRAALLLDEAGWIRDGESIRMKGGKPLALSIMTNAGNHARETMAAIIKSNLEDLGFDITLDILEWGTVVRDLLSQQFDMVILGWTGMGPDPDDSEFWAYRYDDPGSGFNFISYYNEDVDRDLFEANTLAGCPVQGRTPLYHEIQAQIQEDAPYAFLFTPLTSVAWNTHLQGINPGPWSIYHNVEEWLKTP